MQRRFKVARFKNYIAVLLASLCIWRWYWFSDTIGMHDAWGAMHYMQTIYDSWRGGLVPLWQVFGADKQYFYAAAQYPSLPFLSLLLTGVLSFTIWML